MEKRVGIRLGLGVCSTPKGQMGVNLEEKINKMKGKGWEGRYDGNAILTDINGLIVGVTGIAWGGGRGRGKGTELYIEAETSIVGRHDSINSIASLLRQPPPRPEHVI